MPTVVIEGGELSIELKRRLVTEISATVSRIYEWPSERVVVVIHENPDENVARGGVLLADRKQEALEH